MAPHSVGPLDSQRSSLLVTSEISDCDTWKTLWPYPRARITIHIGHPLGAFFLRRAHPRPSPRWATLLPPKLTVVSKVDDRVGSPGQCDNLGPYTPHPTPYTLHPTPYTLHPTPYILHPTPFTLHPTTYTLHPTPWAGCNPEPLNPMPWAVCRP